ncbi:glucoamylase [Hesseltinella vesiculosa]|uniref:glucan 1,4-alpha-glucosidase n=1 Tax=Hesseltinella vesiculosa TaxID=101127 RepID=A0A1X2G4A3_9FUNG|nr:glucoamylase [Hesseltinella vesiculosa]
MKFITLTAVASLCLTTVLAGSFPSGNATITSWGSSQHTISLNEMKNNINPPGSAPGFLAASLCTASPNYYFDWTRDSALSFRVLVNELQNGKSDSTIQSDLASYIQFVKSSQTANLGEPKFNADGSVFTGPWGRPQNDGPAERASTLILYDKLNGNSNSKSYVYNDLNYVVSNWQSSCFDLWEENQGQHFFSLMMMRRALLDGVTYATNNGDSSEASNYKSVVSNIESLINTFWTGNYVIVTLGTSAKSNGLDAAVLLGANIGGLGDGFYTPGSDKILATSVVLENAMKSEYPLNSNLPNWLATAIGRYPGDVYDGVGTSAGNPWFICTNAFAELYYRAIKEWNDAGSVTVTDISKTFFAQFDSKAASGTVYTAGTDAYNSLVNNIANRADEFLSTVRYHQNSNGSISEEFNRENGYMQGAYDLTWSHASTITAILAKSGNPSI